MSKNKNAAKKAASNQTAANNKPAVDAEVKNTTATVEKGKAEVTQQVAAPAATDEKQDPPKKEPAASTPKEKGKAQADPPKASTQKEKKDKKIPTVIAEDVSAEERALKSMTGIPHNSIGTTGSSTDAKAMLAYVGHERFTKNADLAKNNPEQYASINRAIDAVWVLGMLAVQQEMAELDKQGKIKLLVSPEQVIDLKDTAELLGIKLTEPKALPDSTQLAIEFEKANVPAELREVGPAPEIPELDITKIKTVDQEKAALNYLMRSERNIVTALVNTVEWLRKLRIEQADNADTKLALDDKTSFDWITEIFNLIDPTGSFKGLGSAVYGHTRQHGSPIAAHAIVHANLKGTGWNEEQTASMVKAMINENFRLKRIENPDLKPSDDKAVCAMISNLGDEYIDKLLANLSMDIPADDPKKNELEEQKKQAKKMRDLVRMNYFPSKYQPTEDELRMAFGQIINLYRDPMDRLEQYRLVSGQIGKIEGEYPANPTVEEVIDEGKKN